MAVEEPGPYDFSFLWDLENTKVASRLVDQIFTNVEGSLKTLDERYKLADVKLVVGNLRLDFINENRPLLRSQGCRLVDAPKRQRVCAYENCGVVTQRSYTKPYPNERPFDVADRLMLQELQRLVFEKQLAQNILLATGDSDFRSTIQMLQANNYKVFVAAGRGANCSYVNEAEHGWIWEDMSTRISENFI
uniref:NYN domain-containing protein n=1 Tax=Noccaea caerulescens TaxID=107243 RepID=A0A1J3JCB5_NOCCA